MSAWGAADWSAVASAAAALATAAAGFMALIAAKWTIRATNAAASENAELLRKQIALQQQELEASRAIDLVDLRQDILNTAYTIFSVAGRVGSILEGTQTAAKRGHLAPPLFSPDIRSQVESCYPLAAKLSRENHIHFQAIDALVHGEPVTALEEIENCLSHIHQLRADLTPTIVSLPHRDSDTMPTDYASPARIQE